MSVSNQHFKTFWQQNDYATHNTELLIKCKTPSKWIIHNETQLYNTISNLSQKWSHICFPQLTATIFRNYLTPSLIISLIKNNFLGTTQLLVTQRYYTTKRLIRYIYSTNLLQCRRLALSKLVRDGIYHWYWAQQVLVTTTEKNWATVILWR